MHTYSYFSDVGVLVAEDEETSRLILCEMLERIGVTNYIATDNGESAIAEFLDNHIDLVITDWNMKPMDGMDLTRSIRDVKNGEKAKTPIIMLTGLADQNAVLHARHLGMSQFLAKPIKRNELASRMHMALSDPVLLVQQEEMYVADMSNMPSYAIPNRPNEPPQFWEV